MGTYANGSCKSLQVITNPPISVGGIIFMKITLEQHGNKISIETESNDLSAIEFLDYVCQLMLCAGYHHESVKRAVYEKADML